MFFQLVHENLSPPKWVIYMGKDQQENEELIQNALPTDVWFHVDALSSAHVYLRLTKDQKIQDVPAEIVEDCCQLVKANSIEGCKRPSVKIVYTMWSNLRKEAGMAAGQVGFHNSSAKAMHYKTVEKNSAIINRIKKTQIEKEIGLIKEMKSKYEQKQRELERKRKQEEKEEARLAAEERKRKEQQESYADVMLEENMVANTDMGQTAEDFEDDFM